MLASPNREIYRFGFNYYPARSPNVRFIAENETVVRPQRGNTVFLFLHYMF